MIEGYGIVLPWGSIVAPEPVFPEPVAGNVRFAGILEATIEAIAESDNEIGGFVITRLTNAHIAGTTTLNVESTLDWPIAGKIGIDGIVYYYTGKTLTTFTGITHIAGGIVVTGLAINHRVGAPVIDVTLARSYLELLRRSFLVDYAVEEDLNVIGRNLGVLRLPIFGADDQYREVIKSQAYCPKGATQGLELALNALVGAGNFEIYEDLINYHNTVFIKLDPSVILTPNSIGKTYLTGATWGVLSGVQNVLVLGAEPFAVQSVELKDLSEEFDFRSAIPSTVTYPYWEGQIPNTAFTYAGTVAEGTGVIQVPGVYTSFKSNAPGGTVYYKMLDTQGARITPESYVEYATTLAIPEGSVLTAGKLLQVSLVIADGALEIRAGTDQEDNNFGLFATEAGGHLGNTYSLIADEFYDIIIKKFGTDYIELWVNGILLDTQLYSAFTVATIEHELSFGLLGTPTTNTEAWFKELVVQITNNIDYWEARELGTGTVNTVNPTRFILSGSPYTFTAGDVGKGFTIAGSGIVNSLGGNNNGTWLINSYINSTTIELLGKEYNDANVSSSNPTRIIVEELDKFTYPDDLGKEIIITNSVAGNNGTYIISKLLQPGTFTDFSDFSTPLVETTNICEVVAATFVTETGLTWKLKPVFVTEIGLNWVQASAGSFADATLTLRQALWTNGLVMEAELSNVLTGQILKNVDVVNSVIDTGPPVLYKYYPFYLLDTVGELQLYLDTITAAGVIPEVSVL